jgi:hypothetical protein
MGRSKSHPIKKRPRLDEAEVEAIALLQNAPQEEVEQAAADLTRLDVQQNWPYLILEKDEGDDDNENSNHCGDSSSNNNANNQSHKNESVPTIGKPAFCKNVISSVPSWAHGLGSSRKIDPRHFCTLLTLHQLIKAQSSQWTSWSGNPSDPRKRAFGFLPGTLGYNATVRQKHLDISMPWRQNGKNDVDDDLDWEEKCRNERAMVVLDNVPNTTQEAIDHVCQLFREILEKKNRQECNGDCTNERRTCLAGFLQYRHLIAAQPNLHNGRALLPVHLDHPRKDGFGVIIITIAMMGAATILLQDVTNTKGLAMPLAPGEAYMLADMARNACVHGVLADVGSEHRESLNLRFGLHDFQGESPDDMIEDQTLKSNLFNQNGPLPLVPSSEVLQYWGKND